MPYIEIESISTTHGKTKSSSVFASKSSNFCPQTKTMQISTMHMKSNSIDTHFMNKPFPSRTLTQSYFRPIHENRIMIGPHTKSQSISPPAQKKKWISMPKWNTSISVSKLKTKEKYWNQINFDHPRNTLINFIPALKLSQVPSPAPKSSQFRPPTQKLSQFRCLH